MLVRTPFARPPSYLCKVGFRVYLMPVPEQQLRKRRPNANRSAKGQTDTTLFLEKCGVFGDLRGIYVPLHICMYTYEGHEEGEHGIPSFADRIRTFHHFSRFNPLTFNSHALQSFEMLAVTA